MNQGGLINLEIFPEPGDIIEVVRSEIEEDVRGSLVGGQQ
jgi:hypothetical protein